jgi:hypothetical protein
VSPCHRHLNLKKSWCHNDQSGDTKEEFRQRGNEEADTTGLAHCTDKPRYYIIYIMRNSIMGAK